MPDPVSDDAALPTAPGVTVANYMGLGAAETLRAARLADDLGYGSFWTAEIVGPEAFALLAAAGVRPPTWRWAPASSPSRCARRCWRRWARRRCRTCTPTVRCCSGSASRHPW
ncbi:MAG: hypothetical protein R2699_18730 [Acidimicrobiales bacterium]